MIDWKETNRHRPIVGQMLVMFTEDEHGHRGGVLLGTLADNGKWYWFKGLEEVELRDYQCTWWCEVSDPLGWIPPNKR